tara:strand:+ start:171 stop:1361 length:1191 start_codon:yes stop_codon:yes gene_type:complete
MAPAREENRLPMIDITRGFAVMGIVLMNIIAFSMPQAAYINPNAWGGESVADRLAWLVSFVLVDGKMRGLFSLLYGASMILLMDRAEMAGKNGQSYMIVRSVWLFMFGIAHYLLLWWGDILTLYAVIGLVAMRFAGRQPLALVKLAFLAFAAHMALLIVLTVGIQQDGTLSYYPQLSDKAAIHMEIALYQGSWAAIFAHKLADIWHWGFAGLLYMSFDTLGFMLLGMAMLKGGFLSGNWAREQYLGTARHCFLIGLPPMLALGIWAWASGFNPATTFAVVMTWSFPFRIPLTVGYAALILAFSMAGLGAFLDRVAAAGRMAFSNYLLSSLVMTGVFYGWGSGMFASVPRAQVYLFVLPMWALMLFWSPLWLARFRYGPAEWLWRGLTLGKLQNLSR